MVFTDTELKILRIIQKNIPISETPYKDIADKVNTTEEEVISFIKKLCESGVIRRFGASIKHQKTGWTYNAMVAWKVEKERINEFGEIAQQYREISHCYYRPSPYPEWQYVFYTMIHGKNKENCQKIVDLLKEQTGITEYEILESEKELKKISMTYFPETELN